jgi:hypothetical protein
MLGVMKPLASARRLAVEAAIAAVAGAATSAAIYSDWWQVCCRAMAGALFVLSIPSYVFAILLGGGVHSATKVHYYVGIVLQFVLVWFLARWLIAWRAAKREHAPK